MSLTDAIGSKSRNEHQNNSVTSRATGDAVERARAYIAQMPEAISGSGGHTATWNVARKLADFGLSEREIFSVLLHDYNPRCQPPWSDSELAHKANDAFHKREPRPVESRPLPSRPNGSKKMPSNGHGQPPPDDDFEHGDEHAPDAEPPSGDGGGEAPPREQKPTAAYDTIATVIARWSTDGPLVHEPTGIASLDELTGGGPCYGTRWYLSGAPDAGKTALLLMIADVYARRGIAVGLLAVDEEPGDMVTRFAQRAGWQRWHCELRDPKELERMRATLAELPIRFYDEGWTIESAATDLAAYAKERGSGAMLGVDSVQTVTCDAEIAARLVGRDLAEVQAVTARSRAIRAVATKHRLIALSTSELGRSAYRSADPAQQTSILASSKWSGALEYSARVMLGLRNVPGESDLIDLELAKNKHGPQARPGDSTTAHVFVRIDRRTQTLTETNYEPPVCDREAQRDERSREQTGHDADGVLAVIQAKPGIETRNLYAACKANMGIGRFRVDAALAELAARVECRPGPNRARCHYATRGES